MLWPFRIAASKLRPLGLSLAVRSAVVAALFALFLWGDYALFRRVFAAIAKIEALTPFFAVGLIENLLGMVFLTATTVLFFSSLTVAIGSFFSDFDLDLYHAAPVIKTRIVVSRWLKTAIASSYLVVSFMAPIFVALAVQYETSWLFVPRSILRLLLLLVTPLNLAIIIIILLVRLFPVRRVHQVAVTLGVLMLTVAVVGFRISRPERFFQDVKSADVLAVLEQIRLPGAEHLPPSWLAESICSELFRDGDSSRATGKLAIVAAASSLFLLVISRRNYFTAFVRARETMAPVAIGSGSMTRGADVMVRFATPPVRAMVGKEIRVVTRDAAQWSQLLMMVALLFIYLYNIKMLPLSGDARATLVAYANVGMAGFVIAAISLRFAYPSISSEGNAFWLMRTAPVSYRTFVRVKVLVYAAPLVALSMALTVMGNVILAAPPEVWVATLVGSAVTTVTLVSLGVGMGGWSPNYNSESPLQVGLSLGGFAYMAVSMMYVGTMLILVARPVHRFLFRVLFGFYGDPGIGGTMGPALLALAISIVLGTVPLTIAARRLSQQPGK